MNADKLRARPFPRLVLHFASLILQTGQESGASELNLGIGGLLALLAAPGGFTSILLFDKYSSLLRWLRHRPQMDVYWASLPDKYFFIVLSMVITGLVVVIKWDKILPGPQDYTNLAPLPLRARTIFFANLAAIVVLASVFALDVNAVSAILFPGVVLSEKGTFPELFAFVGVHITSVLVASAFVFFGCFAVMGALMAFLPNRVFRSVSLFVRLGIIVALITMLCTSFTVQPVLRTLARHPDSWMRWLPSLWYIGLYQSLQGRTNAVLVSLMWMGLKAAAGAFVLALAFSALSYRRYFLRIPESSDASPPARKWSFGWMQPLFDRWILRDAFQRACYHFGMRALLRSEIHCIICGAFVGLGLVLASQMAIDAQPGGAAIPNADLLAAPLAVAYLMILGLRFVFEVPSGLNANWVYKVILDQEQHPTRAVARKMMLTFLVPGVLAPVAIAYSWVWGVAAGLLHAAYVVALSAVLMEIVLLRFRKIPFTCTLPLFENHALMRVLIYVIGFFVFTNLAGAMESWMLRDPVRFAIVPVLLVLCWDLLRRIRRDTPEVDARLIYEESAAREVQALNILSKVN